MLGPLEVEYLTQDVILNKYQQEDKADVANSFRWNILLSILNDELHIQHESHGVHYEIQDLEKFLSIWWQQTDK